jgi:hypothetical protein
MPLRGPEEGARENRRFFKTLRDGEAMKGRGLILTTTNKKAARRNRGDDSEAFEIVGKPYDVQQITSAITAALRTAAGDSEPTREGLTITSRH